jgi:hypothetical protein
LKIWKRKEDGVDYTVEEPAEEPVKHEFLFQSDINAVKMIMAKDGKFAIIHDSKIYIKLNIESGETEPMKDIKEGT